MEEAALSGMAGGLVEPPEDLLDVDILDVVRGVLNVFSVLDVLDVLDVFNVLDVLDVLDVLNVFNVLDVFNVLEVSDALTDDLLHDMLAFSQFSTLLVPTTSLALKFLDSTFTNCTIFPAICQYPLHIIRTCTVVKLQSKKSAKKILKNALREKSLLTYSCHPGQY